MGCVRSSEIIRINDNREDKTDNNEKKNITNSISNSDIKDEYQIQNNKKKKEDISISNDNNNQNTIKPKNVYKENKKIENIINENIEVKAEIIQAPPDDNSLKKTFKNKSNLSNKSNTNNSNNNTDKNNSNISIPEIIKNKFDILEETNRNQMTINYKIRNKKKKNIYKTLKIIRKNVINKNSDEKKILSEIEILKQLKNENIIQVEECIVDNHNFFVIAEYCQFGSLRDYMNENQKLTETQTKYIISQILKAVLYLNSKNFVHTDIKPENVLIEKIMKKRDEELCDIKLLDFGSSSSLKNNPSNNIPIKNLPYYVSPEIIDRKYNAKCDIWSIGVIMYEMLFGIKLFNGNNYNEVIYSIKNKELDFNIEKLKNDFNISDLSEDAIYLLKNMLIREMESRFDAKRCLEHPWFVSLKEFDDLDEDINTDSNKKNSHDSTYNNNDNHLYIENNDSSFKSSQADDDNNVIIINDNDISDKKKKGVTGINIKFKFENIKSERSNRTYSLRSEDFNKEKEKESEFVNLTIKYIHFFYRKKFNIEKEVENLKKLFDKYKDEEDMINIKDIILCFNIYSGYENNNINSIPSNEKIETKFTILYPNKNNLNFDNFKTFILSEKENDIVHKLKNKYKELEKTRRDEIKSIFNEINKKSSIQRYFDEMKKLMDKDKLKEIYLFNDYLKIIEKTVCKLNSKEEIEKFNKKEKKLEEEKEKEEKRKREIEQEKKKKLEEKRKKEIEEEEKKKKLEEERKKEIEEEYKRKIIEEEERRKQDEEKKKKREEEERIRLAKNNEIINKRNSYIKNGKNDSKKNSNAFNPEEFLKLVEKH